MGFFLASFSFYIVEVLPVLLSLLLKTVYLGVVVSRDFLRGTLDTLDVTTRWVR